MTAVRVIWDEFRNSDKNIAENDHTVPVWEIDADVVACRIQIEGWTYALRP